MTPYRSAGHMSHRAWHCFALSFVNRALCPGPPEPLVALRPPGDDRPQALSAPGRQSRDCRALIPDAHKTRLEARLHHRAALRGLKIPCESGLPPDGVADRRRPTTHDPHPCVSSAVFAG